MNILFENKYYFDKKSLIEYVKNVPCKNTRILGFFFLIISFFYGYFAFKYSRFSFIYQRLIIAVISLLIFIISLRLIFYYLIYLKKMEKNILIIHNGIIPESNIQFTEDNITIKEGKTLMEFEYNQIKNIKEYKSIYALMLGKRNGILLRKDHFTIGTFEEFKKFINNKYPNKI